MQEGVGIMNTSMLNERKLVGREIEINLIMNSFKNALNGKGSTLIISGEPGIGKTWLVEEFKKHAEVADVRILSGAATSGTAHPFQVFSKALESITTEPLFEESEHTSFKEIFAVNTAGLLLGKASSEEGGLDADIFAGMLSAVQDFVRDRFGQGGGGAGLGRLEYGDMKILIEHGQHLFLTAVFSGNEHSDMKSAMKQTLRDIEQKHGQLLNSWTGRMSDIKPVQDEIVELAGIKFLVRKDLEGVKLESERVKIADRALESLASLSREKPIALLLEDFHWADESSIFVLRYIARNIIGMHVLILVTARPSEGPEAQKVFALMQEEGSISELRLAGLDSPRVRSLVNGIFPRNTFPPDFSERLHRDCDGNPFFITELLRQMLGDGAINSEDGQFFLARENYTMPSSIGEIVNQRMTTLPLDAMALAEYASCIGREFPLEDALTIQVLGDANNALRSLEDAGIITLNPQIGEFRHAMFQSTIYGGISPRWKGVYHKGLGEHIERTHIHDQNDHIYELARHFSLTAEHSKTYVYCVKAGEKAENAYAAEQAASYYLLALGALSSVKGSPRESRVLLLERLGGMYVACGEFEQAYAQYACALEESQEPSIKARLHRKMSAAREKRSDFNKALEEVDAGEKYVTPDELEYWRLEMQRAGAVLRRGDFDVVIDVVEKAIPKLHQFEDTLKDIGRAYSVLGFSYIRKGSHDKAIENLDRAMAIMKETGDHSGMSNNYNNIGILHYNRGELDKARANYENALRIFEERRDQGGIALLCNNIALVFSGQGDLERGLDLHKKSLAIRERMGDKAGIAMSLVNMGEALSEMGDGESAMKHYMRNLDLVEKLGDHRGVALACSNIATQFYNLDDISEAEAWYEKSIETSRKWDIRDYLVEGLLGLAQVRIAEGKYSEAELLCTESEVAISQAGYKIYHAYRLRILGKLISARAELVKAEELFNDAMDAYAELKAETEIAKTLFEWGEALAKAGEKERSRAKLLDALGRFEAHGMRAWAGRCRRALGDMGL